MPLLPVHVVLGDASEGIGKQFHAYDLAKKPNRQHIPKVLRHDVGHQRIDLLQGVGLLGLTAVRVNRVSALFIGSISTLHPFPPPTPPPLPQPPHPIPPPPHPT